MKCKLDVSFSLHSSNTVQDFYICENNFSNGLAVVRELCMIKKKKKEDEQNPRISIKLTIIFLGLETVCGEA